MFSEGRREVEKLMPGIKGGSYVGRERAIF
jgi:hypothetical protein